MQLDAENLFANDIEIGDAREVIDLGDHGIGAVDNLYFFVAITEEITGATGVDFALYTADDAAGTVKKTELLSKRIAGDKLQPGVQIIMPLPVTRQKYSMLEVTVDGTATGGKYYSGLTTTMDANWNDL